MKGVDRLGEMNTSRVAQSVPEFKLSTLDYLRRRYGLSNWLDTLLLNHVERRGFKRLWFEAKEGRQHALVGSGDGRCAPVALLHGLGSASVHYSQLVRYLRPYVKSVVMPDNPGHGFSEQPDGLRGHDEFQATINSHLDSLLKEPAYLFGNSLGGFAAIRYALRRPEMVKGLVLCSPGGAQMSEAKLDEFLSRFNLNNYREAAEFMEQVFGKRHRLTPLMAWRIKARFNRPLLQYRLNTFRSNELLDAGELRRLQVPILLIWGKRDKILPPSSKSFFMENLPKHAQTVEPENFGHAPFLLHPRKVGGLIVDFIHGCEWALNV
ncbi:MAG: alpha/beta hydrolase [Myxococcota bacterium]|nr:alpha/beta hydrolase [Myxococcota bacterium]